MSTKRVVVSTETDVTANGRLEGMLTTPSPYYDNKDLIDFLSLNNSKVVDGETNSSAIFPGVKLIQAPAQLTSVITAGLTYDGNSYDIKLYINGVRYYQTSHFTIGVSLTTFTLNFLPDNLAFDVTPTDEVIITGKFVNL